jgi:hypothetical protein
MKPRRINANNEDLIGAHYRLPGGISPRVVEDADPEREGVLLVVNSHGRHFEADAYEVRAAVNARAARDEAAIAAQKARP